MKITDRIAGKLQEYLQGKYVLEIACGDSDFSLSASKYASNILATDISLERFYKRKKEFIPVNIDFKEMDAKKLNIEDSKFDVVVCYNALAHLKDILKEVLNEVVRVTKKEGYFIIIATWKLDKNLIPNVKNIIKDIPQFAIHNEINERFGQVLVIKKA